MIASIRGGHWLVQLPEFRLFACFWGSLAALGAARAAAAPDSLCALLVTAVVAGCSLGVRAVPALALGLIGWLLLIGFVVNDGGALRLTGVGDLAQLVVLLGVAQGCALTGRNFYAILTPRGRTGPDRRPALRTPARADRIDVTLGKR